MTKIVVILNGCILQEIVVDKEKIRIGRHPKNDVVIDNRAVSGEHALITCGIKDVVLEDLNSTNGTLVNGQPIKRHFVQERDVIELAKYKIQILRETQIVQPKPVAQAAMVKVLNGANAGKVLLLNKPLTTIGRPGDVAAISRASEQYNLTHVEGSQPLLLNGNPVGREPKPLQNGDVVVFAGTEMAFIWA